MRFNNNAPTAFGSRPAPVMPPEARNLLRAFDYASLGDGNPTAGMNTLVSMCATLSAVAGPDASIENETGDVFAVGINWLVAGSLSPALHVSRVLSPLWRLQSNLSENAELAESKRAAYQQSLRPKTASDPTGRSRPKSPISSEMRLEAKDKMLFGNLLGNPDKFQSPDPVQAVSQFLEPRAFSNLPEFARNPAVIHNGNNPKLLSKELARSHRRHPLVDFPVNGHAEAHAIGAACLGVIDGNGVPGKFPAPVKGLCTARMQQSVFADILKQPDAPGWTKRMLWLTDMPLKAKDAPSPTLKLDRIQGRYEAALDKILTARLSDGPTSIQWDLPTKTHHEWVAYLVKLEPQFPGISGVLASLLPSLIYGFCKLATAGGLPDAFGLNPYAVLALAKHLAERMIFQHQIFREEELTAFKQKTARSILAKLQEGPQTDSQLKRRHSKLLIGPCREILAGLESAGLVRRSGEQWELTLAQDTTTPNTPVIDVI